MQENPIQVPVSNKPTLGRRTAFALFWNFIGRMGMMGVRLLESIVMVWLLGKSGFGQYKSAYNIMAIALPLTVLGLEAGLSRFLPEIEAKGKDSRPLLRRAMLLRIGICIAVAAYLILDSRNLAEKQLHDVNLYPMIITAGIILGIHSIRNMQYRVLVARFRQKFLNGLQVGEGLLTLACAAVFVGLFGWGGTGALAAIVLAGILAVLIGSIKIRRTQPEVTQQSSEQSVTVRRLIAFSGAFYAYNLIATIMSKQLGILLIPRLHPDIAEVAYYEIAWTIAFFAVSISGKALAEGITLTIVAEAKESGDPERLRKIYSMLTEYMYILAFPAVAGIYAVGEEALDYIYHGEVQGAWVPLMVYLPFMAFHKMGGLTANFLAALDRERLLVAGRIVTGIAIIVLDIWLIPIYGALGAVLATSSAISLSLIYEMILVQYFLSPRYPIKYLLKMALIGIAVGLTAFGMNLALSFLSIRPLRLGLAISGGVIVYLIGLWLLKPISADNLRLLGTLKLPGKGLLMKFLAPKEGR